MFFVGFILFLTFIASLYFPLKVHKKNTLGNLMYSYIISLLLFFYVVFTNYMLFRIEYNFSIVNSNKKWEQIRNNSKKWRQNVMSLFFKNIVLFVFIFLLYFIIYIFKSQVKYIDKKRKTWYNKKKTLKRKTERKWIECINYRIE